MTKTKNISKTFRQAALDLGFNSVKFLDAKPLLAAEEKFLEWRDKGCAADMNYLLRDNPINARPQELLKEAKTIIMLTASYYSPVPERPSADYGRIASYAVGLDYHKVLKKKIKELVKKPELEEIFKNSRFFTDAVPFLEKSFAAEAGLGFQGRNTLLISRETGSFNFIAEILTDIEFETEANSYEGTCGKCTRCIDACPTDALVQSENKSYLDARKCISYLTIENRNLIDPQFHTAIGDWLFGCDICQDVCPYNKKLSFNELDKLAKANSFVEFQPESGLGHWIYLPEILSIKTDEEFHEKFCRTPLSRAKRSGLLRNAIIVAANNKATKSLELVQKLLDDQDPLIAATAKSLCAKH